MRGESTARICEVSLLHAYAKTSCCSNAQHDQGYCHLRQGCTNLPQIIEATSKVLCARRGPWSKFHTEEQQILGSTVQNLATKATDAPDLCTTAQTERRYMDRTFYCRAAEPMARSIHCCPTFFLSFFCPTRVSTLWRTFVYTHIWMCTDCVWITVATKQHCSETFLRKSERCEVLTGYLLLGRRSGGEWANTWHWTERFTGILSNGKQ